jgi:hypothetical protein
LEKELFLYSLSHKNTFFTEEEEEPLIMPSLLRRLWIFIPIFSLLSLFFILSILDMTTRSRVIATTSGKSAFLKHDRTSRWSASARYPLPHECELWKINPKLLNPTDPIEREQILEERRNVIKKVALQKNSSAKPRFLT